MRPCGHCQWLRRGVDQPSLITPASVIKRSLKNRPGRLSPPGAVSGAFQPLTQRPPTVCIPTAHLAAFRRATVRMQVPLTM